MIPTPEPESKAPASADEEPTKPRNHADTATAVRKGPTRAFWFAAASVAIVVAVLVAAEASGWPFLRGPLERNLQRLTGVSAKVDGDFRVHLFWRPGLTAERLTIGPAEEVAAPHLLQADAVTLRWRWADVWRFRQGDTLRIQSLTARHIDANLLRLADGRATWHLRPTRDAAAAATTNTRPDPVIDHLQLDTGSLRFDDVPLQLQLLATLQAQDGTGEGMSDRTSELGSDRPGGSGAGPAIAPATGPAIGPGTGLKTGPRTDPMSEGKSDRKSDPATERTPAGLAVSADGHYRGDAVKVRARAAGSLPLLASSLAGSAASAPMTDLNVDAQIGRAHLVFAGQAGALLGASRLKGDFHLSGPSLAAVGQPVGVVLPATPPFDLHGRVAHDGTVWSVVADRATIGSSALGGAFSYDTAVMPARLSGRLTGTRLALKDLGPAIGTDQRPQRAGRVLPDVPLDLPRLSAMDANVLVDIKQLDLGTTALAPLMQVRTHLRLQHGVLQLDDLAAVAAGGKVSGSTRLDTRPAQPQWTAALAFVGLDVAGWVRGVRKTDTAATASTASTAASAASAAAKAPAPRAVLQRERQQALKAPDAPAQAYLTGLLDAQFKLSGQGRSVAEILATLQGDTRVVVRDGTLSHLLTEAAGLDVAQALGVAIRGDRSLPLRCARVDAQVQRGVLVPSFAVVDNADTTFRLNGQIDLRDETLALRLVAEPKDFSPLSLRSPITIGGTLSKPAVSIDARQLGVRAVAAIALAAVAPVAALIPFLEAGKAPATDPCRPALAANAPVRQKSPPG